MSDPEVSEAVSSMYGRRPDASASQDAELDQAIARTFGRVATAGDQLLSLFQEAGLTEESAVAAARGLDTGRYFSFEDAALSQTWTLEGENHKRNPRATPERIAEVARRLPEHLKVQEQEWL